MVICQSTRVHTQHATERSCLGHSRAAEGAEGSSTSRQRTPQISTASNFFGAPATAHRSTPARVHGCRVTRQSNRES